MYRNNYPAVPEKIQEILEAGIFTSTME